MLSYLHSFHAGNHADILKHITLLYTLEYFNKKDKPYTVFDTHSGRGLYDLHSEAALKTGEASKGIGRLLEDFSKNAGETSVDSKNQQLPDKHVTPEYSESPAFCQNALASYIDFVSSSLKNGFYPGSPAFERAFLKEGSTLFLTELHKTEYSALCENIKKLEDFELWSENVPGSDEKSLASREKYPASNHKFSRNCTVKIENKDGFSLLKASVPPVIKRGFVLCDPSYEEASDYTNASEILSLVHKKWSGASLLLWYPLLSNRAEEIENMKQAILSTVKNRDSHTEVLDAMLLVDTPESHTETSLKEAIGSAKPRLYGSGMFVVNPCWGLDEHLSSVLTYLSKLLDRDGNGSFSVEMM